MLLYADQVIRGAERTAQDAGYAVLVAGTRGPDSSGMVRTVTGKVDGLVVLAGSVSPPELQALAHRVRVVLLAARRRASHADLVAADNEAGAYAATDHLVTGTATAT